MEPQCCCRRAIVAAISWLALRAAAGEDITVRTPLGEVRGVDYGDFKAFKGLPYAAPPERFAPPVPKAPWPETVTRDATHFGDVCMSGGAYEDADPLESYGESEDCLYANVWVPKNVKAPLPVMIFVHGGGFMLRSGSFPPYWGDGIVANRSGPAVLLVTFNYRLAIFGFFSSDEAGANFGLQDQQLLLKWVQENIAAFGGDPSRVTLSGQSAGAMSVVSHLAAPGSAGLFQRAVIHSAVGLHYRSPEENAPFVRTVAKAVGCNWAADLTKCMRSKTAWELKAADIAPEYLFHLFGPCDGCDNILPWLPVVDGKILPQSPVAAFRAGSHNKVPTFISTTRNETLAFTPTILREVADSELAYDLFMRVIFEERAADVRHHYATSPDTAEMKDKALLAGVVSTDAMMTCYTRYVAKVLSAYSPVFLSTFLLPPTASNMPADHICISGPPDGAACHAGDISYFLPNSARMTQRTRVGYSSPLEASRAEQYATTFINFAHGIQGPLELYSNASDTSAAFDLDGWRRVEGYHKSHCDFFESAGFPDSPWGGARLVERASAAAVLV